MKEYRHHVRRSAMKARMLTGDMLLQRARKMGVKTANGLDLWSISLLRGNVSAPGAHRASFVTRALPVDCCC